MQDLKDHHLKAVKQVIRYIKGTKEHGIIYKKEGGCKITGYSDSSYGINTDQGKGTTSIVFYFGESPITWCTQKQPTVALSSCESEFMAATRAAIPIIAPTIPPSLDYMPTSLDYPPTSDTESDPFEDPSSYHIPPLPAIPPFLSSTDDTTDSDTLDIPSLPTHDSSSDASSDFHSDASSGSSSRHLFLDHSSTDLPSTFARPSRRRRRSSMTVIPALPLVSEVLSPVHADLILSPKRVKDSVYLADVEVDPKETSLRDDVVVRSSDKPYLEQDIDPKIQLEIDECIAYADALRDRGIDAIVVVKAVDREESETGTRGRVEGRRIVGVESAITALTERIDELESDNIRLRGIASVETQSYLASSRNLIECCIAKEIEARKAAMNLEPLNENGDEQEGRNGGNRENGNRGNRGNRNGRNGNGKNRENRNGNIIGIMARTMKVSCQ
nr:ribonuclease H-like domain, reverse transcriptase, RNA-dependent DNA polymerase [Tanacetum cinerariifolium]